MVLGGIHPTVVPDEPLKCKGVDIVVRGEGEETFSELVSLVSDEKDYREIAGVSLRKNGSVVHNPNRPMIMDIDDVPAFPYHLFEQDRQKYPTFGSILTSRGCPYNCTFCFKDMWGHKQHFGKTVQVSQHRKGPLGNQTLGK